jgi:hypothetical protein
MRSTDGGQTWSPSGAGIDQGVVTLAVDARDGCRLYATSTRGGIYQSADGGTSWTRLQNGLESSKLLPFVDPSVAGTVYAIEGVTLLKSVNRAQSFVPLNLAAPSQINRMAIDPAAGQRLFVGTAQDGVLSSQDGGATWLTSNDGLMNPSVAALVIDAGSRVLHAGTSGGGVFELMLPPPDSLTLIPAHPFNVQLSAVDQRTGRAAKGLPIAQTAIFGYFSLPDITFDPGNPEVFVKILDATSVNGKYWVFYGGLTDLEYTLTVTEQGTGKSKNYNKPAGSSAGGFDTAAFP